MHADEAWKENSISVLQRLLGPIVHRWIWRRRLERSAKAAVVSHLSLPDEAVMKTDPLFSTWPIASLQRLRAGATLIYREAGMTLALAKEPRRVSGVFWLLSGKVTQVPTTSETRECAMQMPMLKDRAGALTGPVVFPTLFFSREQGMGCGDSSPQRVALIPVVESVLDSLLTFSAGRLVDAAALMLGAVRQRALRCQVASTLLFIPFHLLDKELHVLRGTPLHTTLDAAKSCLKSAIARRGDRPSPRAILSHNPLLGTLETTVLRRLHAQLTPFVFAAGDVLCADVFTTDTLYFLRRGQIVVHSERGAEMVQHSVGVGVGLHSFVPYECPLYFDERRRVTARTYCEAWGIPLALCVRICDEQGRLACAAHVSRSLQIDSSALGVAAALRAAPCFAKVSDDTIASVVQALRVHVSLPGDCVLSGRRLAKSGVMVVCGRCVLAEQRDDVTSTSIQCGVPLYFCEAFANIRSPQSIYARSVCIVLYGSPSSILNQLDMSGVPYEETDLILESARNCVEHVYGRIQLERSKAQEQAIQRVRAYDQKERGEKKRKADALVERSHADAVDSIDVKLALENQFMTSLALQLQSLHADPLAAERFKHLHGLDKDVAWKPSHDHSTTQAESAPPTRHSTATVTGCFTLDESGALVHTTSVADAATCRKRSLLQPRREGYDVLSLAPPSASAASADPEKPPRSPCPPPPSNTAGARFHEPPPTRPETKADVTSARPSSTHGLARQKGVLRTRDLRVPLEYARATSYTGERRRSPPPRLEALRKQATALTDEAYGINQKPEPSHYARKRL